MFIKQEHSMIYSFNDRFVISGLGYIYGSNHGLNYNHNNEKGEFSYKEFIKRVKLGDKITIRCPITKKIITGTLENVQPGQNTCGFTDDFGIILRDVV